jgi:RNA polymerase sigma-70 factor (ECF subfamily)
MSSWKLNRFQRELYFRRNKPIKIIRASHVYRGMGADPAVVLPVARPDDRTERLAALFDSHEERLYRLGRRLTASAEDARDLVQETFLRAARSLRSVPSGHANEEAWLVRVLINIRRDQWRKATVRKRSVKTLHEETSYPSRLESALIAKRAVWAALDLLEPRRRAIVIMHELEGMSPETIASLLGVSRLTVQWHLSMGRRDLKRVLMPHVGDVI